MAARNGYSPLSVSVHWLAAILIIALFFTHEAEQGTAFYAFHVGGGAIAGIFLLWRVWHRVRSGFAENPNQYILLALLSKAVLWGFLVSIVVVVVSGYLLPWSLGKPIDLFGIVAVPSPIGDVHVLHEFMEEMHEVSGHLFVPLLGLHILGWAKHKFVDRDQASSRMFRPDKNGA